MHRTIGGLAPLEPGYRRILMAPQPGGGLQWAETSLETPLGLASVRWEVVGGRLEISATVPDGGEASYGFLVWTMRLWALASTPGAETPRSSPSND